MSPNLRALRAVPAALAVLTIVALGLTMSLRRGLPAVDGPWPGTVTSSSLILDRHGRLLYEVIDPHAGRHQPVPLEEIPLYLRQATVATEDSSFYTNPGVDLRAIVRAIWINVRGGEVLSGGSTITQQLARNLLLSPMERGQQTLSRKLRESILAYRLARDLPKDHILELYLNETYYGNMAYGVEAAANAYFGKHVRDLDLAECALLAGLPQAPAVYDPLSDLSAARSRQRVVLGLMAKSGYITSAQEATAQKERLSFAARSFPIRAPHFVMYVWRMLEDELGQPVLAQGGLRVYTTLDLDMQERAEDIARQHLQQLSQPHAKEPSHNVSNVALVALDPHTGEVLTMLGSPDYFNPAIDGAVNMARMPRQPGSAIKPLTYALAFSRDYTPATMLLDVPTTFFTGEGDSYIPVNYDRTYRGPVLLREALGSSLNIVAVKVLDHVGTHDLVSFSQELGITTLGNPRQHGLALTLGGAEVRLVELTAAYGVLANGGLDIRPQAVLRVQKMDGTVLAESSRGAPSRVLDERVAFLVTDVLSDDSARIPAFGEGSALLLTRPAAAKTGTTSDWRDNWTIGYTPDLVAGVWVGNADNSPMTNVSGISGAAPIWHSFMEEVLKGKPPQAFPRPEGLVQADICADSGLLPNEFCPHRRLEWFVEGTEPVRTCDMHRLVRLDPQTGDLATQDTPVEQTIARVAVYLPSDAWEWAQERRTSRDTPLFAARSDAQTMGQGNLGARIAITQPVTGTVYRISPSIPAETQCLEVKVVPSSLGAPLEVSIYCDQDRIAVLREPPYSAWWQVVPGAHVFRAEATASGGQIWASAPVQIAVVK